MVYLAKQKRGQKEYYYLVEVLRLGKDRRKQIRQYVGTTRPSQTKMEILSAKLREKIEKEQQKVSGYHYLLPDEIQRIDKINSDFQKRFEKMDPEEKEAFEQNFVNTFVYNSNSIEGSTLTKKEVALLLEENIAPNKPLEDVLEAKNAQKVIHYLKNHNPPFTIDEVQKWHEMYFKDTKPHIAGKFKTKENWLRDGKFQTTLPQYVLSDMKNYFFEYDKQKNQLHPLELAAWAHWKFEKIHPFQDGNGRTGRLIMNHILNQHHYGMIDIKTRDKREYRKTLAKCDREETGAPLSKLLIKRFVKQYQHALEE